VAAAVSDIANCEGCRRVDLPLHIQRPVFGIRELIRHVIRAKIVSRVSAYQSRLIRQVVIEGLRVAAGWRRQRRSEGMAQVEPFGDANGMTKGGSCVTPKGPEVPPSAPGDR
jgi:hypothetical protein